MKPAGWRTTTAFHLRAFGRRLRLVWFDVLDRVEDWWEPEGQADEWDEHAINEVIAAAPAVAVAAVTWVGPNWSRYPDGRSDVWVEPLREGSEWRMVDAYLRELHLPAPTLSTPKEVGP
jgi:hypothetical protein